MSDRWRYRIRNLFSPATLERLDAPGNGAPSTGSSSPQSILHAVNLPAKVSREMVDRGHRAGRSALRVASAINRSPARRAVLRSHHGVGISFAVALQRSVKAHQHAIQNAQRALEVGHH